MLLFCAQKATSKNIWITINWKSTFGINAVLVTDTTLWIPYYPSWHMFNQFANHLRSVVATGGIGGNVCITGKV